MQNEAKENIKLSKFQSLIGFDKSIRCVNATKTNVEEAGLAGKINVERADFFQNKGHEGVFCDYQSSLRRKIKKMTSICFIAK